MLRVIPHPANFAPVGATAVFAGRTLSPMRALGILFGLMLLSDALLAFIYDYPVMTLATPFVYGGFAIQMLCGRWLRSQRGGALAATFFGSVLFFLISNLGVWVDGHLYAWTFSGLVSCYAAALPFFRNTLLGDLFWIVALTFSYEWIAALVRRVNQRHGVEIESLGSL